MSAIKCSNSLVSHSTTRVSLSPFRLSSLLLRRSINRPWPCCTPVDSPMQWLCVASGLAVMSIRSFFGGACCCRIDVPFFDSDSTSLHASSPNPFSVFAARHHDYGATFGLLSPIPTDMRRDVQEIFRVTPHNKQVMMFSATLAKEIRVTCKKFMSNVCIGSLIIRYRGY
jgi:hypothetical protein